MKQNSETTAAPRPAFDWRTFGVLVLAGVLGAAWAAYNLASTGGRRGEEQLQPLVWVIFATPFFLFIGWAIARRLHEIWLAAFTCFCIYFYTPFVAARIESLQMTAEQARDNGHMVYFQAAIAIHLLSTLVVAVWRARTPPPAAAEPAAPAAEPHAAP